MSASLPELITPIECELPDLPDLPDLLLYHAGLRESFSSFVSTRALNACLAWGITSITVSVTSLSHSISRSRVLCPVVGYFPIVGSFQYQILCCQCSDDLLFFRLGPQLFYKSNKI